MSLRMGAGSKAARVALRTPWPSSPASPSISSTAIPAPRSTLCAVPLSLLRVALILLQEWLQGCYDWLIAQPNAADPTSQKFLDNVVVQLLQSDLTDSMVPGTGIPVGVTQPNSPQANSYLGGTPILVEIVAITEIGTSAYQLEQIRATREQRLRLGQTDEGGDVEADLEIEGEGPVPRYPRGMLRFDLSDGSTTINAIEYRPIPELALSKTPLGFKVCSHILSVFMQDLLIDLRCFLKTQSFGMASHS